MCGGSKTLLMMGVGDGRFVRRAWNGLAAVGVGLTTVATAMAVVMTVRQGDGHVARVAQRFFTGASSQGTMGPSGRMY